MMVWLVYPLTTIVPNYSAFRKRNRRLFNRELLRQARRRLATSSILAIVWPHVHATQSTDSGATWSPNVRMTSAQSNFDGNDNGPGDYSSSTPFNSAVWPFFSDHRNANPQTASGGGFDVYTVNADEKLTAFVELERRLRLRQMWKRSPGRRQSPGPQKV